jgi:hypothetical protein
MTLDEQLNERVKLIIGDQIIHIAALKTQIDELQKRLIELQGPHVVERKNQNEPRSS